MLFSLDGYSALVTGASGSIGRAISRMLAEQGASVVISGTRLSALEETAKDIKENIGKEVKIVQCDLSSVSEARELFQESENAVGQIDILVNNAGINRDMLFAKMTEEDLYDVLDINLRSVFTLTHSALAFMGPRRYGRIINISSVVGFSGNIGQANYCASKAGIVGMSKAIALECARKGITINCVAPGAISSPMIEKLSDQARERFMAKIPMNKIGEPEDVGAVCCFLASKEASYITGQTFHVNGGMLMV